MPRVGRTRTSKPKAVAETFGQRLRRYRKSANLTQEDLARLADVAAGTISSAERGHGSPRDDTILKLAVALRLRGPAHQQFMAAAARATSAAARRQTIKRMPAQSKPAVGRRRTVGRRATSRRLLQVFLCHASEDKPSVRRLYRRLKSEPGIEPWLDEVKLLPGHTWDTEIRRALRNADVVVICVSKVALVKIGYVQREMRLALDAASEQPEGAIFVIPLRLEDCSVPESLQHLQRVDFHAPGGYQKLLLSLRARAAALSTSR